MTSLGRILAAAALEATDVTPCGPFAGFYAARLAGVPLGRYVTDGEAIAMAQVELQRRVGHDAVVTAADTYYLAEGFGLRTTIHDDALPTSNGPLLATLDEVDRLRVPDPERDGRMPVYLQAVRSLSRRLGDTVAIRGTGTGPFSVAAYLYGDQRFLMTLAEIEGGMADERAGHQVDRLLRLCAEASARFIRTQICSGEHIAYLGDSLSSVNMISPSMYRRWAQPYQKLVFELVADDAKPYGARTLLHVCGDNRQTLADMAATGADIIEIDHAMDLAWCRSSLGPSLCLIGNLDPVSVVQDGTAEEVREGSQRCIRAAGESGFILGTGCFVTRDTPLENLVAMVDAARETTPHQSP